LPLLESNIVADMFTVDGVDMIVVVVASIGLVGPVHDNNMKDSYRLSRVLPVTTDILIFHRENPAPLYSDT